MAKIGEGSLAAYGRTGVNEFRNMIYADSNVAQKQVEYGMWGHPTPGEVAASRANNDQNPEQEGPKNESVLESRMRQTERSAPERSARGPVMDR